MATEISIDDFQRWCAEQNIKLTYGQISFADGVFKSELPLCDESPSGAHYFYAREGEPLNERCQCGAYGKRESSHLRFGRRVFLLPLEKEA